LAGYALKLALRSVIANIEPTRGSTQRTADSKETTKLKDFNWAMVISSLFLGLAIVAAGFLIGESIDSSSEQIASSLQKIQTAMASAPGAAQVRNAAPPRGNRPDPNRKYTVSTAGSPSSLPGKGKIEIVEFSDFQCPFCKRVNPTINRIKDEYGEDVRIVFKHMPLSIHPQAKGAHAASEAAHKQGKFWEMHDLIFKNQRQLNDDAYLSYAKLIGLDVAQFQKDVKSAAVLSRVEADIAEAGKLGVTGTPAFFINGRFLSGAQPYEAFKRLIDEEMKKIG
jgi:protein-disulfide isomerase